jgi:predicted phosphodiesterase
MKIAIISDVHSNFHGLKEVLDDVATESPDIVVGAGDMIGTSAYPRALDVWRILRSQKIPIVRGNEEDRLLNIHSPDSNSFYKNSVRFMPLQTMARQFSMTDIEEMKALPLSYLLKSPNHKNVFVCHALRCDLHRYPVEKIDTEKEKDLNKIKAKVVVVGHYHSRWHECWQDKLVICAGSSGLPLRGKLDEVEYLILTYHKNEWRFQHKPVKYDYHTAIQEIVKSDYLEKAGPIGWLMFDEALTQEDHLTSFFRDYCPKQKPEDLESWKKLAIGYLTKIKRWEIVKPFLQYLL